MSSSPLGLKIDKPTYRDVRESRHRALRLLVGPPYQRPATAATPYFTQTVFIFVNSRIPLIDNSRPWPERFTPPKGTRGSDATIWLIKTIPASNSLMKRSRSAGSLVHALAPKPKRLSLAS